MFARSTNGDRITDMASNGTPMETKKPIEKPIEIKNRFEAAREENGWTSESRRKGAFGSVLEKLGPEIRELEGIAIGAVGALIRDLIKRATAEPLAERLEDVANRVTEKLGGDVIKEPLLADSANR